MGFHEDRGSPPTKPALEFVCGLLRDDVAMHTGGMKTTAEEIDLLLAPYRVPIDLGSEECGFAVTTNPWANQPIHQLCCVVLCSWLPPSFPVGMFVTIRAYEPAGETARALEVGAVFAAKAARGPRGHEGATVPMQVGRWMVSERHISHHSPDRNDSGDAWARAIGGVLPTRDQRGNPEATSATGAQALGRLNSEARHGQPWPEWPPADWTPIN